MSEVGKGFEHHSLNERRVLYTLVFLLLGLLVWLESSRLLLGIETARAAIESNVSAHYKTMQESLATIETEFLILVGLISAGIVAVVVVLQSAPKVYLVDFTVLHPSDEHLVPQEKFMVRGRPGEPRPLASPAPWRAPTPGEPRPLASPYPRRPAHLAEPGVVLVRTRLRPRPSSPVPEPALSRTRPFPNPPSSELSRVCP